MGNLIMPKQTSAAIKFYTTLSILYKAQENGNPIVSNSSYKQQIINAFANYSSNSDSAMIVKQSEMVRYFGFAFGDFANREIRITETGIELYEAHEKGDTETEYRLIAEAIINHTFGRGNTAIKSSDSDIDPPKLFIKSIMALNGITNKELQLLLALTHDYNLDFESALNEINNVRANDKTIVMQKDNINKYNDTKFGAFLSEIGFCYKDIDGKYQISEVVSDKYAEKFSLMSIYNKMPEITYTTIEEIIPAENDSDQNELYKKRVSTTVGYDVDSEYFKKQNCRKPKQVKTQKGKIGYSTNARIAKTALELADYKCAYDDSHITFINKADVPFMEPHHLIPMAAQHDFKNNLDRIENIVSLCPTCHSAIHYGNVSVRHGYLERLYLQKIDDIKAADIFIDFEELLEKYYK